MFETSEGVNPDDHETTESGGFNHSSEPDSYGENSDQSGTGTPTQTPSSQSQTHNPSSSFQSSTDRIDRENYDDSSTPKKFKSVREIYQTLDEEELCLMGIDEPVNYAREVKDAKWRAAMTQEMSSIEANETWRLT